MTDRKPKPNADEPATPGRKPTEASQTKKIAASGDNRRLGDTDGNRNAGDARSPGADDTE